MTYAFCALLITAALMLAMMISLALQPSALRKLTGWIILFVGVSGLALYSLGYGTAATTPQEMLVAALQAAGGTVWLFGGRESYSAC